MGLKDYIEEKEENEMLNEDAGAVAATILGVAGIGLLSAMGGAQLLFAASRGVKGILRSWKVAIAEFKSIKDPKSTMFSSYIEKNRNDPLVKKTFNEIKQTRREFEEVLKDVYKAIEEKSFTKENNRVAEEFKKIPKNLQNSPDVKRAIVSEIVRVTGEPPVWPPSPGNITYQAIKYSLGIRDAKAEATAFRYNAMKTIQGMEDKAE